MLFRLRWIALLGITAIMAACSEKLTAPPIDIPFPIDTTRPGGNSGGGRTAALDVVQALVRSLPGQDFDSDTQLLVTLLRAMPQFAAAGASPDGTVWARFQDGVMMMVVHGGPLAGEAGTASSVAKPDLASLSRLRGSPLVRPEDGLPLAPVSFAAAANLTNSQATPGTVPKSEKFILFDGIGNYFSGTDPRPDVFAMLTDKGYTGKYVDGTVGALRQVQGEGIFYMRTHGGMGSFQSNGSTRDMYALWTATEVPDSATEARDAQLVNDLRSHRLVYMLFRSSRWTQALPFLSDNKHYGITEQFIADHMTFSENSLIYIDACQGAVYPSFRNAFKNASVFIGWNERAAFSSMGVTAKFMFDRMLGANKFAPESPHQRPFEYDAMTRDPKFGAGKPFGYSTWRAKDGGLIKAELTFNKIGGDFGILAPSIMFVQPMERQDELWISGYFGADPGPDQGKVTIDDASGPVAMHVKSWTPDLIKVDLPRKGGGSTGNVVVSVRNHKSNPRQLLTWEGTFAYESDDTGMKQKFDMDIRARADIHDVRISPGTAPVPLPLSSFDVNASAEARYSAQGSVTFAAGLCSGTETWAGAGTIQATPTPSGGKTYVYSGHFDAQRKRVELTIGASDSEGIRREARIVCPTATTSSSGNRAAAVEVQVLDRLPNGTRLLQAELDDGMNIAAGQRRVPVPAQYSTGTALLTLNWPAIRTKPRFDPDIAR